LYIYHYQNFAKIADTGKLANTSHFTIPI